jgi:hypothetical protein
MNDSAQMVAIVVALVGSYVFLTMLGLGYYAPQLAAIMVLLYFVVRFARKRHLLPLTTEQSSPEFALVSAAVLIIVGSTGNTNSLFFPLAFLHIFLLTMILKPLQAIIVSLGTIFFHFALIEVLNPFAISHLASLLLLLCFFLFAKKQFEERISTHQVVEQQSQALSDQQSNAILFVTTFLKPKLEHLLKLADYPEANKEAILRQIVLIQDEVEQLLEVTGEDSSSNIGDELK